MRTLRIIVIISWFLFFVFLSLSHAQNELTTFERRVSASSDDAEENIVGAMDLTSSDLELVLEDSLQTVGIRFNGVDIPKEATILNAYIQFQVDETSSAATSLLIQGEDSDDAGTFLSTSGDISSRTPTAASVAWTPVAWNTVGEAGTDQ